MLRPRLRVTVMHSGRFTDSRDELVLILPGNELRPVEIFGVRLLEDRHANGQRRLRVRLAPGA
jgi:hypothetical protein